MNGQLPPEGATPAELPQAETGAILRRAREARGLSRADVAQALKLTQRQVEAMESERFEHLPGEAFARGFLRNYCRLLELDPAPLLRALEGRGVARGVELAPVRNAEGTLPSVGGARRPSLRPLILVALVLLLLGALGWYFDWFQHKPAERDAAQAPASAPAAESVAPPAMVLPPPAAEPTPEPVPAAPVAPPAALPATPDAPAPAVPAPQGAVALPPPTLRGSSEASPQAEPAAGLSRLAFEFAEAAWVEVRDGDGKILFSKTNPAQATQEVSGKGPFKLIVGNAAHVRLTKDGQAVDLAPYAKGGKVARFTLP